MIKAINKMIKNKKGFTLVELIVVIAVLGIIATIAVPKFANVQQDAKRDADIVTAKMIAKAAELAIVKEESFIYEGTDGAMDITVTELNNAGYLDVVPKSQYIKDKNFVIAVDTDNENKITITIDNTGKDELYPTPDGEYDLN